jgi:hypothetical protein
MLKSWIQAVRAFIASKLQKFNAYLEHERTREIPPAENLETGVILFLVVLVFIIARLNPK